MHRGLYLTLIFSICVSPAVGQQWKQFGGENRFRINLPSEAARSGNLKKQWVVDVGEGLSGIVADERNLYSIALESVESNSTGKSTKEKVFALDPDTGKYRWKYTYQAGWQEDQEAFGGRKRTPQATPAIVGNTLVTIGFTGKVFGFDRTTGAVKWKVDAVDEYGAKPVQFGFSASPIPIGNQVIILTGGQKGGLVCLDADDGRQLWNVPCGEASYATPVILKHPQQHQVVFLDRDQLVSAAIDTGEVLWRFDLPKKGLTNVPTPLPVDNSSLIVSGQGLRGTIRLDIDYQAGKWSAAESWRNRTQFFYCNWVENSGQVIGCDDKLLIVLDVETGRSLAKWRGFANANLVTSDYCALVVDGKGRLTCLERSTDRWKTLARYQIMNERCWTPPTVLDNKLYCRSGASISCFQIAAASDQSDLSVPQIALPSTEFKLLARDDNQQNVDFVQQVMDQFESDGPTAAMKRYREIRKSENQKLCVTDRQQLMKLAASQGYYRFAREIADHASKDFSGNDSVTALRQELEGLLRMPSNEIQRWQNGLDYVEFAFRNETANKIDAYVRGPAGARFSYGIPIPPGKFRIERWPVGTTLFRAVNDEPRDVILTVKESLAGKTVDLK